MFDIFDMFQIVYVALYLLFGDFPSVPSPEIKQIEMSLISLSEYYNRHTSNIRAYCCMCIKMKLSIVSLLEIINVLHPKF